MVNKVQEIIASIRKGGKEAEKKVKEYNGKFGKQLSELSSEEKSCIDDLLICCVETGDDDVMEAFVEPVLVKKKFMPWKNKLDLLKKLLQTIVSVSLEKPEEARYNGFVEKLMEMMDAYQLAKHLEHDLVQVMSLSFKHALPSQSFMHLSALNVFVKFPWKTSKDSIPEVTQMATSYVIKHGVHSNESVFSNNLMTFLMFAFYMKGNDLENHKKVLDDMTKCFVTSAEKDWEAEEDPANGNIYRSFVLHTLQYFVQTSNGTKAEILKPFYNCIKEFRGSTGDEEIEEIVTRLLSDVADDEDLAGDDVGSLIEEFIEDDSKYSLAHKLKDIYLKQPQSFDPHLEALSNMLKTLNDTTCSHLVMLFTEVAKLKPETLPSSTSGHMANILNHQWYYSLAAMYFDALATSKPEEVLRHEKALLGCADKFESASVLIANSLPKMAVDKKKKEQYLEYLSKESFNKKNTMYLTSYLNSMRLIGLSEPSLLRPYKSFYEDLLQIPTARDMAQSSLDIIEGRSLQKISEHTEENRKKIENIEDDVEELTDNVGGMKTHMDEMDDSMDGLKRGMDENVERMDKLDEKVDDTQAQVQEIDQKTLSHAPAWSREVSKILNNQSDGKDWKLLGRRLGFTNEELSSWSLHADPCMSMLDEWFAVNNAREATRGVLAVLDDMQAVEAWKVLKNAVDKADDILCENEKQAEVKRPNIFLSYQWAHQDKVKILKEHLEKCGYTCWMDVGQMGGGDKLYKKIDEGMRAVKVVLCCVSQRYSESPNCNREVNLAVTLGKPMIPLLMEEMKWPPEGSMGPIFGEFLYIQFFKSSSDSENKVFWPQDNFKQLATQIKQHVQPENVPNDSPYMDWFGGSKPSERRLSHTEKKGTKTVPTKPTSRGSISSDKRPQKLGDKSELANKTSNLPKSPTNRQTGSVGVAKAASNKRSTLPNKTTGTKSVEPSKNPPIPKGASIKKKK